MQVIDAIKDIINERVANKVFPEFATLIETKKRCQLDESEFKRQTKELIKAKSIRIGLTLNSFAFYLINENNE